MPPLNFNQALLLQTTPIEGTPGKNSLKTEDKNAVNNSKKIKGSKLFGIIGIALVAIVIIINLFRKSS